MMEKIAGGRMDEITSSSDNIKNIIQTMKA